MNNKSLVLTSLLATLALTACDSDTIEEIEADIKDELNLNDDETTEATIYGPYSTGSVSEPSFVYFDLETMSEVSLTKEQAKTDTQWDLAFSRSDVYLNNADSEMPVSVYFTDKNSDFFDADGNAIADKFLNATPESELEDFTAVMLSDVPTDSEMFKSDETKSIIADFYAYNVTTHQVSADPSHAYIVNSDDTFSKFKASALTTSTSGYGIAAITLTYSNQTSADTAFAATETDLVVDAAAACAGFDGVYVDFELGQVVSASDAWDISLPCNEAKTEASFEINIAEDSTAMQDFDDSFPEIDPAAMRYYDFEENQYTVRAFDETPWTQYGLNGGHTLWSQYGVYIIKTATASYKLQLTSYYNAENVSGNISFRAEALK
ncbi:HmuY family protein [Colwellia echini]|uniref:Heme-binding HmuY-like protein n=1 Tax=Colwellia echini TaxID=1982103 RepID=A0ABY3MUX1_9GAMM|nr:HmuY family protein [Colwellia echini]TYK65000.1 hypothetical protein CWS31_012810 [Colwellia echini]